MKNALGMVRRILTKNKILGPIYLLYLVALVGYGMYRLNYYITYRDLYSTLYLGTSKSFLFMALAAYAFFLYLGYELGVRLYESGIRETLQPQQQALREYMGASILWLALLAWIGFVIMMSFQVALFLRESYGISVLFHMVGANVLYYFLVPLTAGFMGTAIARVFGSKRFIVYPITVVLVLMSTAFVQSWTEDIYYTHEYTYQTDAAAILLYRIKSWFTFTPYGMGIGIENDSLYGIPQELGRWMLCLFWIAASSLLIFPGCAHGKRQRWGTRLVCGLLTLTFGMGVASQGYMWNDDGLPLDMTWHIEQSYLWDHTPQTQEGGFVIEGYDMKLTLFQNLQADMRIQVSALEEGKTEYAFTLHRYMKIADIKAEDGRPIPFERDESVFRFDRSYLPEGGEIYLRYSGSLPTYFCNEQAAALPSWFCYYPMAGVRPIDSGSQTGNNTTLPENKASFMVEVHAPYSVQSNLPGEGNCFAGESQGLTLMGSPLADSHEVMGITFYSGFTIDKDLISDMMPKLDVYLQKANKNLGCDAASPVFVNPAERFDKVFIMPTTYTVNRVRDNYIDQGDHLWMVSSYEPDTVVEYYVSSSFNNLNEDGWLRNHFTQFLIEEEHDMGISISSDPEYWLKKLEDFSNADPEVPVQGELIGLVYKNCLDYIREHGDGSEMMRIYERLNTSAEECETDEFIFIRDMMKTVMDRME